MVDVTFYTLKIYNSLLLLYNGRLDYMISGSSSYTGYIDFINGTGSVLILPGNYNFNDSSNSTIKYIDNVVISPDDTIIYLPCQNQLLNFSINVKDSVSNLSVDSYDILVYDNLKLIDLL